MSFGKSEYLSLFYFEGVVFRPILLHLGTPDELLVQLQRNIEVKFGIEQRHLNSGLKGRINSTHPIGSQEQYSSVVLETTKKHTRDCIMAKVVLGALSEKNVCFVQEKHTFPFLSELKIALKV